MVPTVEDLQEVVTKLRDEVETLQQGPKMRNRRSLSFGKGIVATVSRQLCSLLHNWDLNTHRPCKSLHIHRMRPAGAPR
jgi:hypothetical protein